MIYFLHGNLGSPEDCLAFKSWFPEEETIALSLWDLLDEDSTLENTGGKLVHICPEGSVIVGYSLGGRLAMHALLAQPSHWKEAIFVSAHFGLHEVKERRERLKLDQKWAQLCLNLPFEAFMDQWNSQPVFKGSEKRTMNGALSPACIAQAFDCWSLGRQAYLAPQLARCTTKWRSFVGEYDVKFRTLWMECFPEETELVYGAGHRMIQHDFITT